MTVISFRYNFIFIKTRKVGGTSLEVALSQHVEQEAVVTPVVPAVEGHIPRNFEGDAPGSRRFYNHMAASEIREILGKPLFASMRKFTVEREPVAKCLSDFHMRRNSPTHNVNGAYRLSWDEYCEAGIFPIDTSRYSAVEGDRRLPLCDEVIPYENMEAGVTALLKGQGLSGFTIKARAKSEYSRNRIVGVEDVTSAQRRAIYEAFSESLEVSGLAGYYAASQ
jgi:hypothetical protein